MRIFGIEISLLPTEDMEDGLIYEDENAQDQIEYVNAWVQTGGYEEYEVFEEGTYIPPKQHWWQR